MRPDRALLVARLLVAALFLDGGVRKLGSLYGAAATLSGKGMPLAWLGALGAASLEVAAAGALVAGVLVAPAALVLAVFALAPRSLVEEFQALDGAVPFDERIDFLRNLVIAGVLVTVAFARPGGFAIRPRHVQDDVS